MKSLFKHTLFLPDKKTAPSIKGTEGRSKRMITSNVIEKKPLSNAKNDNILNNFCELFEGSNEAYTIARTVHG